jgi:pimeloyl-ACP methyl ester carboxylesterase
MIEDTLAVPGARLYYERRGSGPVALLVAAPMGAGAFAPIADLLAEDHTVVTTDPRGINRSPVDEPDQDSTPEIRADDIARLLRHVDGGPALVLGSSGGAVSVLALAQAHPELVHTVVAHEPPLNDLLPDRASLHALSEEVLSLHRDGDRVGSWRMFMKLAALDMPEPIFQAAFGGDPDPQTLADERFQNEHMFRSTVRWHPDVAALRSGGTRVVIGIGDRSTGQLCERTSLALAALLGIEPVRFPGGHTGFVEDPAAFAARLRAL